MITEDAVELLRKVQKALREHPGQFDMDRWFYDPTADVDDEPEEDAWGRIMVEDPNLVPDVPLVKTLTGSCGTTACIGGWAVALAGERVRPGLSIQTEAERLIGWVREPSTNEGCSAERWLNNCPLFHVARWPGTLLDRYCGAKDGSAEQAGVACIAIDRWIEAGGDPDLF